MIKFADFVHVGQGKDEFILNGDTAANQSRISTLGHDADPTVIAPLEYFANLLGSLWFQDSGRGAMETIHPVNIELVQFMRQGRNGSQGR